MKNITLRADERLIARARQKARARNTSLNQLFQEWLTEVSEEEDRTNRIDTLLNRLENVNSGGSFSREEMNER